MLELCLKHNRIHTWSRILCRFRDFQKKAIGFFLPEAEKHILQILLKVKLCTSFSYGKNLLLRHWRRRYGNRSLFLCCFPCSHQPRFSRFIYQLLNQITLAKQLCHCRSHLHQEQSNHSSDHLEGKMQGATGLHRNTLHSSELTGQVTGTCPSCNVYKMFHDQSNTYL